MEEQLAYLKKGVAEIVPEDGVEAEAGEVAKTGKPLRVYLGVDPTAPDIHLGHTVVLRKLKHFQDMGHTAIFLIGDFSAMIGDPTGQSETRPPLSREQVDVNAKTYLAQVYKILDPEKTEVRYNSEWLGKMSSYDVVRLCGHYRLARMLEREDFRSRLDKNLPIAVHELLYPLLTAYDAVMLQSDVELGATEQKFNILVHREIQREYGLIAAGRCDNADSRGARRRAEDVQEPRELRGDYGSAGRNVREDDVDPGRADVVVLRTGDGPDAAGNFEALKKEVAKGKLHPMDAKMRLAEEVVADFREPRRGGRRRRIFSGCFATGRRRRK